MIRDVLAIATAALSVSAAGQHRAGRSGTAEHRKPVMHRPTLTAAGRRRRRSAAAHIGGFAAVLLVLACASAAQAVTLTGALTGTGDTWDPSAATDRVTRDTYLGWTLYDRHGDPNAFLRVNSDPRLRLNRRGFGWAWSLDAVTQTAAYQQARRGNADVRLYDWASRTRSNPGPSVNTMRWEYEPAVSGDWLVFGRLNRAAAPDVRRIILDNLLTDKRTVLAVFNGSAAIGTLESPEISGDWVTWTSASDRYRQSSVHRYQISTGHSHRIPHPAGRLDYLSAIGSDGTVYFVRSRGGCGHHVSFESYTTAGALTTLGAMPAGRDGGDEMFAAPQSDGSTSLYFDSYGCTQTPANGNIYLLNVPAGATAAGRVVRAGSLAPARHPKRFPASIRPQRRAIEGMP
jgi:hypothetical protein